MRNLLLIANVLSILVAIYAFCGYFITHDFDFFHLAIGAIVINIWGNKK